MDRPDCGRLWAVGVNAITFNRIGKEDTLLVFFMLFAFYFYLRAKQTDTRNVPVRKRNYLLSGVSFGLMSPRNIFLTTSVSTRFIITTFACENASRANRR